MTETHLLPVFEDRAVSIDPDIRKHLETMLDILDEKEWIQGALFEDQRGFRGDQSNVSLESVTGVCLAGSFSYGVLTGALYAINWYPVANALIAVIEDLFPDRGTSVPFFNDYKDTTFEDIRLVVKTAIEKAAGEAP